MDFLEKAVQKQKNKNERIANSLFKSIEILSKQEGDENLKVIALLTEEYVQTSSYNDRILGISNKKVATVIGKEKLAKIQAFYPPFIIGDLTTPYSIYLEVEKMNTVLFNDFKKEGEGKTIASLQDKIKENNLPDALAFFTKISNYNKQLFSDSFIEWINRIAK